MVKTFFIIQSNTAVIRNAGNRQHARHNIVSLIPKPPHPERSYSKDIVSFPDPLSTCKKRVVVGGSGNETTVKRGNEIN